MAVAQSSTPVRSLWLRWKSLRLPWRKQFLCGSDLDGNTFWEFKDAITQGRFRRIVKYTDHVHHSDVNIPPQWIQWLRHTRKDPPSLEEQQLDIVRQQRMKKLAAEADARWASKPSFLVAPAQQGPQQSELDHMAKAMLSNPAESAIPAPQTTVVRQEVPTTAEPQPEASHKPKDSPWASPTKKMDEPDAWSPKIAKRR